MTILCLYVCISLVVLLELMRSLSEERSLAGETLEDYRTDTPKISLGVVLVRHNDFRCLQNVGEGGSMIAFTS